MSLSELHLRAARARVAAAGARLSIDPRLGSMRLRGDQLLAVGRVTAALARDGGCVLADDVGRGKTYVALAVAQSWTHPLVVAPASLRAIWADAMRRAGVSCAFESHEALSRGRVPSGCFDGIIVDESHRFRSTSARRHAVLAALSAHARLLLLSATPLQNGGRDLAAQVALFHGTRAFRLDARALATFVVRGAMGDVPGLPTVTPPTWIRPVADDGAVLDAIVALPSPARPADGGDAGVLRTIGLVRAWASSRAALVAMLRRRRRVAAAIEQCAAAGLVPTKRELRAWQGVDADIQLGFAPLLANGHAEPTLSALLLRSVSTEHEALDRLSAAMAISDDPDLARACALREIRAAHPGECVLAFTELASTARTYYSLLRDDAGIGLLTADGARIASGRLPRDALLARFAPRARGVEAPPRRERVTMLIATDLLSEGVNLQDASVVVHLDLPWNPARLAQRVGRVRRPGGAETVSAYLVAPPARTEHLLDVERRLRRKLAESASTIGTGIEVVPRLVASSAPPAVLPLGRATLLGQLAERMARWRRPMPRTPGVRRHPIVAAAESAEVGWLAALDDGRVLASMEGRPPDEADSVVHAAALCERRGRPLELGEGDAAIADCQRWLDVEHVAKECGHVAARDELDAAIERRIAIALERCPRHDRPAMAALAARLRESLGGQRTLGLERSLRALLEGPDRRDDPAWLTQAATLLASPVRGGATRSATPRVTALIVLGTWRHW